MKENYDERVPHAPRDEDNKKYWAYFAPNGYVCVRSIAPTKKMCRTHIAKNENVTYVAYEAAGYVMKQIDWTLTVLS